MRWPRVSIEPVDATLNPDEIANQLIAQNPDAFQSGKPTDIIPIFKRGSRDESTTKWICEVSQVLFHCITKTNMYLGFNRCRVQRFEEVTQCFKCLRYGHPASKCFKTVQSCAHCAGMGHLS